MCPVAGDDASPAFDRSAGESAAMPAMRPETAAVAASTLPAQPAPEPLASPVGVDVKP